MRKVSETGDDSIFACGTVAIGITLIITNTIKAIITTSAHSKSADSTS